MGKSTLAWMLAQADAAAGAPVAFVDIDQLGMCYPAPIGDADRWQLKEKRTAASCPGLRVGWGCTVDRFRRPLARRATATER